MTLLQKVVRENKENKKRLLKWFCPSNYIRGYDICKKDYKNCTKCWNQEYKPK